MQSFVGKLTHACPDYYCSRSARPRALPAGLSGFLIVERDAGRETGKSTREPGRGRQAHTAPARLPRVGDAPTRNERTNDCGGVRELC